MIFVISVEAASLQPEQILSKAATNTLQYRDNNRVDFALILKSTLFGL